jgi:hypothetical protein
MVMVLGMGWKDVDFICFLCVADVLISRLSL